MDSFVISTFLLHPTAVYPVLSLIGLFEGPFIAMVSGFVLSQGYLNFWIVYICLMFADLVGDVIWYAIGSKHGHGFVIKYGKYVDVSEDRIEHIKTAFRTHASKILFLSKISNGMGLAIPILFTAGVSKINFLRFVITNISGQLLWSGMLISVGYFFGKAYTQINSMFDIIGLVVIVAVLVVLFVRYQRYLRRQYEN